MQNLPKFRGISTYGTNFIYGNLKVFEYSSKPTTYQILSNNIKDLNYIGFDVKPETIGQFTGLFDNNGAEIYKDDILKNPNTGQIFCIIWNERIAGFSLSNTQNIENEIMVNTPAMANFCEVIGNIFENPELLPPKP